jgi:hypothetical protein
VKGGCVAAVILEGDGHADYVRGGELGVRLN